MLHLYEGTDKGRITDEMEKRKSPSHEGIRTHHLSVMKRELQPLPEELK